MAISARDAILSRLRSARATARLPREDAPAAIPTTTHSTAECLDRLQGELLALGVDCYVEASADAVRARVAALVAGLRVFSWDPAALPYDAGSLVQGAALGASPRVDQAAAEIGLTGCDGAIAETGTLAMLSAPGRARTVSLLPPVHLAIVRREDLCFTMGEFFEANRLRLGEAASCTFITGPSRTADIELTLTLGIHGPGQVIVVVGP